MSIGRIFGGGVVLMIFLRGVYLIYRSLTVRYGFLYASRGGEIVRYYGGGDGGIDFSALTSDGGNRAGITFYTGVAYGN